MLGEIFQVVGLGFGLSFLGAIPFGIINLTVARTTVKKGFRAGVYVSAGASLVEFFQVWISLNLIGLLIQNAPLQKAFQIVAFAVFAILAAVFFRAVRNPNPDMQRETKMSRLPQIPDFILGALVSSLNMVVYPFWIFYGAYFSANGLMKLENLHITIFAFSTLLGVFSVFLIYAGLGTLLIKHATSVMKYFNWFLFVLFVGLAIYQVFQILLG